MNNADKRHIVYQIWTRSFFDSNGDGVGDIPGIIQKLDHIASLGADMIWLNPIYVSPDCDYGYDIADYYAIQPCFGTLADFDRLVAEAKARNIGIIMDFVPNHVSDKSEWFKQSIADKASKYRDYFYFRPGKDGGKQPPNNWLSFFGGSAWTKDASSGEYYLTSFAPGQCDINWDNPALREEMYAIMRFWLDRGVAGFRMDVVNVLKKAPGLPDAGAGKPGLQFPGELICDQPGLHDIYREMNEKVLSHYDCFTVGEGALITPASVNAYTAPVPPELMMMFHFDMHMLGCGELGKFDFRKLYRWSIRDLKRVVFSWQAEMQRGGGWTGNYLSNHDQPRDVSRFGDDKRYRAESACALALMNFTLRGTPFVYQGEECGMTNCRLEMDEWKDVEAINCYNVLQSMMHLPKAIAKRIIMKMTRDHSRTPVQWNAGRNAGFTEGTPWQKLNPNYTEVNIAAESAPGGVVDFYRRLIALHKQHDILTFGSFAPVDEANPRVIAYVREYEGERWLIAINLTSHSAKAALHEGHGKYIFGTHGKRNYESTLALAPWEGCIFRME